MLRKTAVALTALATSTYLSAVSKCGDDYSFTPFAGMYVEYRNVVADKAVKKGKFFAANTSLGKLRPLPKPLTPNDELFEQGQELYNKQDLKGAVKAFLQIYKMDKKNPFVINALARTYYRVEGESGRAINAYIELIKIIEKGYFESEKYAVTISTSDDKPQATVVIDPWFLESYWKLGTLYLDYQDYPRAVFEMSKMYYYEFKASLDVREADRPMATQLFAYLTEAHFHLKNKAANNYFFCRTKEVNPQNTYVDQFELK